ncbi:uncharacterized protein LOC114757241 [Neltuma alba]|uniref:uncharacterized protein LOC114757241 n=1 Tax=Neltuma alba TaxID=207710 RepID=UPI0010A2E5DD|nr:uncharacterized protein LOC114757241 [Prosopis alba]
MILGPKLNLTAEGQPTLEQTTLQSPTMSKASNISSSTFSTNTLLPTSSLYLMKPTKSISFIEERKRAQRLNVLLSNTTADAKFFIRGLANTGTLMHSPKMFTLFYNSRGCDHKTKNEMLITDDRDQFIKNGDGLASRVGRAVVEMRLDASIKEVHKILNFVRLIEGIELGLLELWIKVEAKVMAIEGKGLCFYQNQGRCVCGLVHDHGYCSYGFSRIPALISLCICFQVGWYYA